MLALTYGTDPVQDVIAAGILVTTVISLLNRRTNLAVESKTDEQTEKIDTAADKLDEVHGLVNSSLTEAIDRRDVSEARTAELEEEARQKE
jgi:hypothetical protein